MSTTITETMDLPAFSKHSIYSGEQLIHKYLAISSSNSLKHAFLEKFTVHPGDDKLKIPQNKIKQEYQYLLENALNEPIVIYCHLPFCETHCLYCGFAGSATNDEISKRYIDSLLQEIDYLSSFLGVKKSLVKAIYLGGGTPSAVPAKELSRLIDSFSKKFNLANDCEITLEGRVHNFLGDKGKHFLDAGFNRISLGVQSFNTEIRKSLGRLSSGEEVISIINDLVDDGRAAVIIDLIYGLPGQSLKHFTDDLSLASKMNLDGLDTYQLNIFSGGKLDKALKAGELPTAAKLSEQGEYYKVAYDYLTSQHWQQLSLSHYGNTSRERNIYNPWAKSRGNCLAIGAGAGGLINGWSSYRIPVLPAYYQQVASGEFIPTVLSRPGDNFTLNSKIIAQMEKGYLNYSQLLKKYKISLEPLEVILNNWSENELITYNETELNLTINGKFWGVNLTQALIDIMSHHVQGERHV